jgi:hypothetical protein
MNPPRIIKTEMIGAGRRRCMRIAGPVPARRWGEWATSPSVAVAPAGGASDSLCGTVANVDGGPASRL